MISPLPCPNNHAVVLTGADISPDSDLDGYTQILATLLKLIPGCIDAADIELLLQGIPVQPPVVIPARYMQEAIQAEDIPPLGVPPWMLPTSSPRANALFRSTSVNTISTQL